MSKISGNNDTKFNLVSAETKNTYLAWMEFLEIVDKVLKMKAYQKIQTPFLVPSGAMESQLETFKVEKTFGSQKQTFDLPTSPEFHLKKALSLGFGDLYEIKTCFRNEEHSNHHKAEFTMLEFYKLDTKLSGFRTQVIEVIEQIILQMKENSSFKNWSKPQKFESVKPILKINSIPELFQQIGVKLTPKTSESDLRQAAETLGVCCADDDSFDEIYFRIWLEKIEPFFNPQEITVVHSYPASQAALATVSEDGWANRFEIYWKGLELGNAFEELADPKVIEKRWQMENEKRKAQGKEPHFIDYKFIDSLHYLPASCGIAIGLERLFMAALGIEDIHSFDIF